MIKKTFLEAVSLLICCFIATSCNSGSRMTSPNGRISISTIKGGALQDRGLVVFRKPDNDTAGMFTITGLGFSVDDGPNEFHYEISKFKYRKIKESYTMLTGKRRLCQNTGREYSFPLKSAGFQDIELRFRLFNDGFAFRYEIPPSGHKVRLDEVSSIAFRGGSRQWLQPSSTYFEDYYTSSTRHDKGAFAYPCLFEPVPGRFVLVSESGVAKGQMAQELRNKNSDSVYTMVTGTLELKAGEGLTTPWRVFRVGELKDVVESTLDFDVAPGRIEGDFSWVRPGVCSWIYWANNHGSSDFQVVRKYIEMASAMRLPYVLIDEGWDRMSNGGTIDDALKLSDSLGVKVCLWYNSGSTGVQGTPRLRCNDLKSIEAEFQRIADLGVAGVKIDFFAGRSPSAVRYYQDLLEIAARHHLMVVFHGSITPRGWQRTYPNLMTMESVLGAEWYNNSGKLTSRAPRHNATLPFIRNVVGSMDYTPCAFSDSQYPHITTHAHELALTVLYESGLVHLADSPQSYYSQPDEVLDFLSNLPASWDDTKLLSGYPGDHALLARKSGGKWYIACVNGNGHPVDIKVDFEVLGFKGKQFKIFADGKSGDRDWNITTSITCPSTITCRPHGGFVIVGE